jgi:hypothetical protein
VLHIYTTNSQPLTKWRIGTNILEKPSKWFRENPRSQHYCHLCYRKRYARNLAIKVYYAHSLVHCAEGCVYSPYREKYARLRKLRAAQRRGESR